MQAKLIKITFSIIPRGGMIKRLRLRNWKSHADSDMEFSKGVNILIGVMGSGKTSIMEAISFGLFGTFPGLKARRLDLESLIMKKPEPKGWCQVEIDFEVEGKSYYVKRLVEKGKGTGHAEIRRDGALLNVNARGVSDEVARALQMDYDLFSKAVYSEQNGLDYFLRIQRGRRMEEVDRMLKVDRFEKARADAVSLKNRVKARREDMLKVVNDMESEGIGEKVSLAAEELGKIRKEIAGLRSELDGVKMEAAELSSAVSQAEHVEKQMNSLRAMIEGSRSGMEEAGKAIERLKRRLGGTDCKTIGGELENSGKGIIMLRAKIDGKEKLIDAKRSEMASMNSTIRMCREGADGLKKAGAKCPVCESEISGEKRKELAARREAEEKGLMEKAGAVARQMELLAGERDECNDLMRSAEQDSLRLRSLSDAIEEMAEAEKRRQEHESRMKEHEERLRLLEREHSKEGLDALRKRSRELAGRESGIAARMSVLGERAADKESVISDLSERLSLMEKYRSDTERDGGIMDGLALFERALKLTQDRLREEFLKTVNMVMHDVWNELYPYGDFTGIRLAIEDDYVLQLKEAGGWVSVEGVVSGGERSMAALALRIAFSMAFLPNLRWLMLDEPTHNLDSNAIRQFTAILREKMDMFAEQVFLITHEERISEGVTGRLYRMERDKSRDEPTKVVAM